MLCLLYILSANSSFSCLCYKVLVTLMSLQLCQIRSSLMKVYINRNMFEQLLVLNDFNSLTIKIICAHYLGQIKGLISFSVLRYS